MDFPLRYLLLGAQMKLTADGECGTLEHGNSSIYEPRVINNIGSDQTVASLQTLFIAND